MPLTQAMYLAVATASRRMSIRHACIPSDFAESIEIRMFIKWNDAPMSAIQHSNIEAQIENDVKRKIPFF